MIAHGLRSERAVQPVSLDLVAEINHRVVNQYSEAIASLSLAANRAGSGAARDALARAAERLRDHAESHRALMPPPVADRANLADYLGRICSTFTKATLADRGIVLVLHADDMVLPAERCWRIGLVLAELIRNAARHGLCGGGGEIAVRVTAEAGGLICVVQDNGRPPVHLVPGQGQQLVRALAADLGGSARWVFRAAGSIAVVQVPVERAIRLGAADIDVPVQARGEVQ
jgi:two-component sensor histidine kinase